MLGTTLVKSDSNVRGSILYPEKNNPYSLIYFFGPVQKPITLSLMLIGSTCMTSTRSDLSGHGDLFVRVTKQSSLALGLEPNLAFPNLSFI